MVNNLTLKLFIAWLIGSALIVVAVQRTSIDALHQQLSEQVTHHLLLSIDEKLFGNRSGSVNDKESIAYVGKQINLAMQDIVKPHGLSTLQNCKVGLLSIDDVDIGPKWQVQQIFELEIPRNQIDRKAQLGLTCEKRWQPLLLLSILLGVLFGLARWVLPLPLSAAQRLWVDELITSGYARDHAFDLLTSVDVSQLHLSVQQRQCFELLHQPEMKNFDQAIRTASDDRLRDLEAEALEWFLWSLKQKPQDIEEALVLSKKSASVVIDLVKMQLTIHGIGVPLAKTPLFYYAWYAGKKVIDDGWMTNPQSNRPDRDQGLELSELMFNHGGHAKAISDLEEVGLKAKTLDQNRSKLKEEITTVFGDSLAEPFLFEHEKDPETGRMRYRLKLQPEQIELIV